MRLLLAARLSRKKTGTTKVEGVSIENQDAKAREWAQREGHTVIDMAADIKSGTVPPWERKRLRPWMSEPDKLALYDGIVVYHVDRLSRGNDEDLHYIEHWAYEHGKKFIMADGPQFPPRSGTAFEYSDKYQWQGLTDAARKEWERGRTRTMDTTDSLKRDGHLVGKYPHLGYHREGDKYGRRLVVTESERGIVTEFFERVAAGQSNRSVAAWLAKMTGEEWRIGRVSFMVRNETYIGIHRQSGGDHLCERIISDELFARANAALDARMPRRQRAREGADVYSGALLCTCGHPLYIQQRQQGRPTMYRCGRGRSTVSNPGPKCQHRQLPYDATVVEADRVLSKLGAPEYERVLASKGAVMRDLANVQTQLSTMDWAADDAMATATELRHELLRLTDLANQPDVVVTRMTGRTLGEAWQSMDDAQRRAWLRSGEVHIIGSYDGSMVTITPIYDQDQD